ncbi:MAG TPA: 1,4-dihydroxy-2-naphthoate octaprenyltransferase [Luteolibacter sp.]|nr:1,4-dihydroxy-2-naphthoate octaprenyltransferase [Luteolibacter sp.]
MELGHPSPGVFTPPVPGTPIKSILLAARPKTLPAAIVPVWAGCVLSWKLTGMFNVWLAVCTLGGAIAIQIATNFFNDAIDSAKGADTEKRLGPKRVTASGLMSRKDVLKWATVFLVIASVFGAFLVHARGWPILAIGIPSLFLAYGYTGGPFPLAYRGMGEIFVILFFGFIAVAGTVFVQTGTWPPEAFLLGGQIGLLSAVLISINNLRDREEDETTGKRTLAVRCGPKFAVMFIWMEIKIAAFAGLGWFFFRHPSLAIASAPVLLLGLRILFGLISTPPGPAYNRYLAMAGVQLLFFALAFQVAAVFAP